MQDNNGHTALHIASAKGHINLVKYLVEKGASVNRLNKVILLYSYPNDVSQARIKC